MKKLLTLVGGLLFGYTALFAQRQTSEVPERWRISVHTQNTSEGTVRGGCLAQAPYDWSDAAYQQTIEFDPFCCDEEWDSLCEDIYQVFANGCDAQSPYDLSDANYVTVVTIDDFCCSDEWDDICESHYEHVVFGCNANSPYGPSDPIWLQVIAEDDFCCNNTWDDKCEALYAALSGGGANLSEFTQNTAFAMYPNPAKTQVTYLLENDNELLQEAAIYDNAGVLVLAMQLNATQEQTLNIEHLNAGLYHVQITTNQRVLNAKLLVE